MRATHDRPNQSAAPGRPLMRARQRRAAATIHLVALLMIVLLGMAALTIDLGMLYVTRGELQRTADAAASAAAWELLDQDRLKGTPYMEEEIAAARAAAAATGAKNNVLGGSPTVDPEGDVTIGYLFDPNDLNAPLSIADPSMFNSARVVVRRNSIRNGSILLRFAPIIGHYSSDLGAESTATFKDGVTGWKVNERTGNAGVLPMALKVDVWTSLLSGAYSVGDNYRYDEASNSVLPGSDGIPELNLYPGAGDNQLPPGNFGTVDIGSPGNSAADLSRQIREGLSAEDLSYHGGELSLGPGGTLDLNGDTGLSAAVKDDLVFIKGQPRAIPLFSSVSGPGNNANFTITGFAGIRVMNVKLTGKMSKKEVIIQPAFVVDDAAITAPGSGSSYFVYEPVRITR